MDQTEKKQINASTIVRWSQGKETPTPPKQRRSTSLRIAQHCAFLLLLLLHSQLYLLDSQVWGEIFAYVTRQTEETMGRQRQRVDWPWMESVTAKDNLVCLLLLLCPQLYLWGSPFWVRFLRTWIFFLNSNHTGSHIPSSWMVHAGCVFVAGVPPSRTWMSGSLESVRWNVCVRRLDLSLYSHPKEIWGNGVRTHDNSKKKKKPSTRRSEEDCTINTASCRTVSLTHYQLSYLGPI